MPITQRYAWKLWYNFSALKHFRWVSSVNSPDLQSLKVARSDNTENTMTGYLNINSLYLNINSLWDKIIDLREVLKHISLGYFVLSETKLNNSFPCNSFPFQISDYEIRARRDRSKYGGGLIELVKNNWYAKDWKLLKQ